MENTIPAGQGMLKAIADSSRKEFKFEDLTIDEFNRAIDNFNNKVKTVTVADINNDCVKALKRNKIKL